MSTEYNELITEYNNITTKYNDITTQYNRNKYHKTVLAFHIDGSKDLIDRFHVTSPLSKIQN